MEIDFYAEVRDLIEDWIEAEGEDVDKVCGEVETILDDAEQEYNG